MKKIRWLYRFLLLCLIAGCGAGYINHVRNSIPGIMYIDENELDTVDLGVPFVGTVQIEGIDCDVNMLRPVSIDAGSRNVYDMNCRLFGFINIKQVKVVVEQRPTITPCGNAVGLYVITDGAYVIDTGDIDGQQAPAKDIIKRGDYILEINDNKINSISDVVCQVNQSNGQPVVILLRRNDEEFKVKVQPILAEDGKYKIGVWVKDDCQGLGTMTYITGDGYFGTLGHAISEATTGNLVEIGKGQLYTARIWSIVKGEKGKPGEIVGTINYNSADYIGEIYKNTDLGVYGKSKSGEIKSVKGTPCEVGYKQEIKKGTAYIRSEISGELKDYEIEITDISMSDSNQNKGIEFVVTDEALLDLTGGIVQGMSGSPIVQNNRIIGAVTHVLINDPTNGYGIFIENMLQNSIKIN